MLPWNLLHKALGNHIRKSGEDLHVTKKKSAAGRSFPTYSRSRGGGHEAWRGGSRDYGDYYETEAQRGRGRARTGGRFPDYYTDYYEDGRWPGRGYAEGRGRLPTRGRPAANPRPVARKPQFRPPEPRPLSTAVPKPAATSSPTVPPPATRPPPRESRVTREAFRKLCLVGLSSAASYGMFVVLKMSSTVCGPRLYICKARFISLTQSHNLMH